MDESKQIPQMLPSFLIVSLLKVWIESSDKTQILYIYIYIYNEKEREREACL